MLTDAEQMKFIWWSSIELLEKRGLGRSFGRRRSIRRPMVESILSASGGCETALTRGFQRLFGQH